MELNTNESWFIGLAGAIVAFFFGKSGIFQKWIDYVIGSKNKQAELEQSEHDKKVKENEELRAQVNELEKVIVKLNQDLLKMTTYVKALLLYNDMSTPSGEKSFISELAKEIRGENELTK